MSLANLDCITVCVDYSEYLALTVKNRVVFDRWMVVTVERDKETISLCEQEGIEYCFSSRLYEGGPFCKGKAINDGLLELQPKDWVCVCDADTYLFPSLRETIVKTKLDTDCLYGLYGRLLAKDKKELAEILERKEVSPSELNCIGLLIGFFQLWHSSMRKFYPEESTHAGLDDVLMRDSYATEKLIILPTYGIHIGEMWINHKGRN